MDPTAGVSHTSELTRRGLMRLVGAAGATALVGACSDTGNAGQQLSRAPAPLPPESPLAAPPPPPVFATPALPPPPRNSVSDVSLCRDAWGARPPFPGGREHTITRMTIHHTAVVLGDNRNITTRLRQHQRYHQDEMGWVDIAYHVGVDRDGNIFELRRTEIAGDTATNYDTTGHFLVVCEGNFDVEPVSDEQLDGAALAFAWAAQKFGITSQTLRSHQQVTPTTACPGANLQAHVSSGDLASRIDAFLVAGGVDLQPLCFPQAADVVAAIEAGG